MKMFLLILLNKKTKTIKTLSAEVDAPFDLVAFYCG